MNSKRVYILRLQGLEILIFFIVLVFSSSIANCLNENNKQPSHNQPVTLKHDVRKTPGVSRIAEKELISNNSESFNSVELDDIDKEDDEEESKELSWQSHQDDHSIYAQRSLMSQENIVSPHGAQHKSLSVDQQVLPPSTGNNVTGRSSENLHLSEDDYEALRSKNFAEKEWQLMFRSFDLMYDSVTSSILEQVGKQTDLFDEIVERLQPDCKRDIYHIRNSVKKHKLWALRMLDSNGKLPSGITYGRFSSPGDYEECLAIKVDESVYKTSEDLKENAPSYEHHKFRGKYCLLDFRLPLPERPRNKLLSIHDPVIDLSNTELIKHFPTMKNYSGYASVFYEVGYMHAFCLPSTCDVQDLSKSVGASLEGLHVIVGNMIDCEQRFDEPQALRKSQVISLALLFLLFTNATFASIAYYLRNRTRERSRSMGKKNDDLNSDGDKRSNQNLLHGKLDYFKALIKDKLLANAFYSECFSIQTNLMRLTKPDPRGLTFVHYTRIVAMGLTVITHTAGLGTLQAITKPADTSNSEQIFRDFIPQMLANAFTSIQIFFFMAGFMLVISTYPSIKRERGHISFAEYAIKRAIRLMPGIAATICLNFLWPLIVDGPMLSYFVRLIVEPCESNWWRTMGFLSNFDHVEKMCLRHSYFSASDYQLHVMAFPLLILLYKQPTISLFIAGLLTIAGFAAQVIMILTKTVLPFMMVDYIDKEAFFNVVHYIHHPVWNHMSAFFYGFIIGYLVIKQVRINLSEKMIKRIWIIIMPAGVLSIFAPYFWNHYKRPIYRWQMVLYVLFDRFILLTTCAWLSYATMVLARKPPAKRSQPFASKQAPIEAGLMNNNLPCVITLSQDSVEKPTTESTKDPSVIDSASSAKVAESNITQQQPESEKRLKQVLSVSSLTRQRSTPNFQTLREDFGGDVGSSGINSSTACTGGLRPALSSNDLSSTVEVGRHIGQENRFNLMYQQQQQQQLKQQQVLVPDVPEPVKEEKHNDEIQQVSPATKKHSAPISNVNTLCLILSRLTFQLYLFNMVVLWIDVNHSKYFWFFSYYFIITKALAVYICSSLMAMVFFITLESPCLTLYISWVKSRAQARGKRQAERENRHKQTNGEKMTKIRVHSDEILMMQAPDGQDLPISKKPPVFSFIDLSLPHNSENERNSRMTSDQTKM